MGINHIDDRRVSGVDLGLCRTRSGGSLPASDEPSGFVLVAGNSVIGAVINTALATLITLSVMSLSFAAYHTLMIRDAAIAAASKAGRVSAPEQNKYLLRLLDQNLPDLATYEVSPLGTGEFVGVRITSQLPGFGFIQPPAISIQAIAPKERVS